MGVINALIAKDGTVRMEVDGVLGSSCTDLTRAYLEALGDSNPTTELKDDYNQETQHEAG